MKWLKMSLAILGVTGTTTGVGYGVYNVMNKNNQTNLQEEAEVAPKDEPTEEVKPNKPSREFISKDTKISFDILEKFYIVKIENNVKYLDIYYFNLYFFNKFNSLRPIHSNPKMDIYVDKTDRPTSVKVMYYGISRNYSWIYTINN